MLPYIEAYRLLIKTEEVLCQYIEEINMSELISNRYDIADEVASSITHGIGVCLAIAGLAILTAYASMNGTAIHVVTCSIYGATLIFQYLASALYHGITHQKAKNILQIFDHIAILLLIAGSYTPFTLVNLQGTLGWSLFGTVWGLAILGIIMEVTSLRKYKVAMLVLYLLMGWTAIVAVKPLLETLQAGGLTLIIVGGVIYSLGVIFYSWKKLPFNHSIWHLFVLAGSITHFFAILFYVIP